MKANLAGLEFPQIVLTKGCGAAVPRRGAGTQVLRSPRACAIIMAYGFYARRVLRNVLDLKVLGRIGLSAFKRWQQ